LNQTKRRNTTCAAKRRTPSIHPEITTNRVTRTHTRTHTYTACTQSKGTTGRQANAAEKGNVTHIKKEKHHTRKEKGKATASARAASCLSRPSGVGWVGTERLVHLCACVGLCVCVFAQKPIKPPSHPSIHSVAHEQQKTGTAQQPKHTQRWKQPATYTHRGLVVDVMSKWRALRAAPSVRI